MANFKALRSTPAAMTSAIARKNLDLSIPAFEHTVRTLDAAEALHGSLVQVYSATDRRMTPEAHAEKYAKTHTKAREHKGVLFNNARHDIVNYRTKLREDAIAKSGLNATFPQGEEVRRALRELPQAERDKALAQAVDSGDAWILASVLRFPPLLTGKFTQPLDMLVDVFIQRASPDLHQQLEECDNALEILKIAENTFDIEAERMRDPAAEARAAEDARIIAEAEAAFAKATGTEPPKEPVED